MAKVLPAFAAFPAQSSPAVAWPGEVHGDEDVKDIVEGQHHQLAYTGRQIVPCQYWPTNRVRVTSTSLTRVLVYVDLPRLHMTSATWRYRTGSDNGGTLRVRLADTGATHDQAVASGTAYGTDSGAVNRPDAVTVFEVWLARDAGGTYIDLLGFEMRESDLILAELP